MVKKFHKYSRSGVTFISAIAIALGGTAVVSNPAAAQEEGKPVPNFSAPEEKGLQGKHTPVSAPTPELKTNNLSGTCAIGYGAENAKSNLTDGSVTGGFSFNVTNPNPESVGEAAKTYGIDLNFDGSKERTFTGWNVTDSVRDAKAVGGQFPALGQAKNRSCQTANQSQTRHLKKLKLLRDGKLK